VATEAQQTHNLGICAGTDINPEPSAADGDAVITGALT